MPAGDSPAFIVARFLKANQYNESFEAFIAEAGLPAAAGVVSKGDLTLETLLEEKKNFDLNVKFEKLGVEDAATAWSNPAPSQEHAVTSLPTRSNLLSVSVETIKDTDDDEGKQILVATTADRRLHLVATSDHALQSSHLSIADAPVLSCVSFSENILLCSTMSGHLLAIDSQGRILDKRQDHAKYVVQVAVLHAASDENIIATAGWDNKVHIYRPSSSPFSFGTPRTTIELPSKPESLLFHRHPDNDKAMLILSRTNSSFLYYFALDEPTGRELGKQCLAPHSEWVAFTPSTLAAHPTDPTLLAVGTNSVPHMKLLIVRLMIPPWEVDPRSASGGGSVRASLFDDTLVHETQASQARAALAVADKESAAILIHSTTMAPQTAYSTPAVAWRPDGSGVWVNGDDGAVRGVETTTGKVIATLQGHEVDTKVRCLWAGSVDGDEWLVSGGFDQKLVVWT